jgi:diguanylate cyclase (GGDEF)-like protein
LIARSATERDAQVYKRSLRSFALLLLLAIMSAGTLVAMYRTGSSSSLTFRLPLFQDFLVLSIAALSCLLGVWLQEDARQSAHPAVCFLETGFFAQALLFAGQCLVAHIWSGVFFDNVPLQRWFGVLYSLWVAQFATATTLAVAWPAFRHRLRQWSGNRCAPMRLATWTWFSIYIAVGAVSAALFPDAPPVWSSFAICMGLGGAALIAGIVLYFRRRRPILLPLTTGLLVFLLAHVSAVLAGPWQLLWWYSYLLYFGGLILIAYGVLEGQRVREREELITRLEELTVQLEEQSVRDPLTGAYNRRHLMNSLEAEFKKALRGRLPLTLLVCDVDNFKDVNDTYGHPCGDFVLREIAQRLSESVRLSDVVGRCGGEEFWILLPQTNRVGGQGVADKTLEAIRQPMLWEDAVLTITMSVGIADTLSPAARDVPSLIHEADRALYVAKRAGKNRAVIMDPLKFSVPT